MSHQIKGKRFALVGFFNERALTLAIEAQGGEVQSRFGPQVDYVVVGERDAAVTYSQAVALGVPVLGRKALQRLLDGQESATSQPAPTVAFEKLFGAVRARLQEAEVSEEIWYWLTKKVDVCEPEHLDAIVHYIEDHVGRWRRPSMHGQTGYVITQKELRKDHLASQLTEHREGGGVPEELRVAPFRWFSELSGGVSSTKYRLLRALDLRTSKLASASIIKMLTHEELAHLHTLVMSAKKAPSVGLLSMLWTHETLDGLRRLHMGRLNVSHVELLVQKSEPRMLHALDLSGLDLGGHAETTAHIASMLKAPYFSTIGSLCVPAVYHDSGLFEVLARDVSCCPALCRLEFAWDDVSATRSLRALLSHEALSRMTTLAIRPTLLSTRYGANSSWKEFCALSLHPGVHTLDLSGLSCEESAQERVVALYFEALFSGEILSHIRHLVLGPWCEHSALMACVKTQGHRLADIQCHAWHVPGA